MQERCKDAHSVQRYLHRIHNRDDTVLQLLNVGVRLFAERASFLPPTALNRFKPIPFVSMNCPLSCYATPD
jgi:hypothetical protein